MVHSTCWLIDMYITQVMYYVLMSSSILGLLFYWVKIRLHTENQLPRLPGSALKVPVVGGVVVASYPLSSQAPTPVEVELGCDNESNGR